MRRDEWALKWATLAFIAGVVLAVSTAAPGYGVRYWLQQFLLSFWS